MEPVTSSSGAGEVELVTIGHIDQELDALLKSSESLRQATLRHAFAGKLVPQGPNDEPASELIKRIAEERKTRARAQSKPKAAKRARKAKSA